MTPEGEQHLQRLLAALPQIKESINEFTLKTFRCRGGRLGSGMGGLLEGLWGFYARSVLSASSPDVYDIAWIPNHAYNDFALLDAAEAWDPETGGGVIFGIEAKSMNLGADETKGHFDVLQSQLAEDDQLLVIVWRWTAVDGTAVDEAAAVVYPEVVDQFIGPALEIAMLRDALHEARGGTFVAAGSCPDGCPTATCVHIGEPLNSSGVRERRTGPEAARGSKTSYQANFGGLKRMVAARADARPVLDEQMAQSEVRRAYVEFVRSFPSLFSS